MRSALGGGFAALFVALILAGCASFVNNAQKSLYAAAQLADGGMKAYAVYWKDRTNHLGTNYLAQIGTLNQQRSNVLAYSYKVGASLALATKTLNDYQNAAGTNTAPKAVVQVLVQTAVQDAGGVAGEISLLTGDPNWSFTPIH